MIQPYHRICVGGWKRRLYSGFSNQSYTNPTAYAAPASLFMPPRELFALGPALRDRTLLLIHRTVGGFDRLLRVVGPGKRIDAVGG
jgi:hypothetical protein